MTPLDLIPNPHKKPWSNKTALFHGGTWARLTIGSAIVVIVGSTFMVSRDIYFAVNGKLTIAKETDSKPTQIYDNHGQATPGVQGIFTYQVNGQSFTTSETYGTQSNIPKQVKVAYITSHPDQAKIIYRQDPTTQTIIDILIVVGGLIVMLVVMYGIASVD